MSAWGVHGMVREPLGAARLIPPARCAAEPPHQLSGAQCQPVVTAGALACDAGLLILREPVLMLEVSLRAGVLRLLAKLHEDRWLSMLYITHDLLSAARTYLSAETMSIR